MRVKGFLKTFGAVLFLAVSSPVFAYVFGTPIGLNGYDGENNRSPRDVFSLPRYSVSNFGYAKVYSWVGSRVSLNYGSADGDVITWNYYGPDGTLAYTFDVDWRESQQCWFMFDMLNSRCVGPGGWIEIARDIELRTGQWRVDILSNGVVTHEVPFTVRGRQLEGAAGQGQIVQALKTTEQPLSIALIDYNGGPASGKRVTYEIIERPSGRTAGGLDFYYHDPSLAGTTSSLSVITDRDGIANLYFGSGKTDGDYTVKVTSVTAPDYSVEFAVRVLPVVEEPPINDVVDELDVEKNRGRSKQCIAMRGNPINVINGNKFQVERDYVGNSPVPLKFTRYYNSQLHTSSALGMGWRHTYMRSISTLREDVNGSRTVVARVTRPDGKVIKFIKDGKSWMPLDADVHASLVQGRKEWEYKENDNKTEFYDGSGRLATIIDKGSVITLTYDPVTGRLSNVDSQSGESLRFYYNADSGLLISMYDAASNRWSYTYPNTYSNTTSSNVLAKVTNPDGTTRLYHYENKKYPSSLTGVTNENAVRYATFEYDEKGRATSTYHAGDVEKITVDYDSGGVRSVTDVNGNASAFQAIAQIGTGLVSSVEGPGCGNCGGSNKSYQFDKLTNNLLFEIENGVTTEYGSYDANGNYGYKIVAKGTAREKRFDYTYDPRFTRKITSIAEQSVYSSGKKVTSFEYDDYGSVLYKKISGFRLDGTPVSRQYRYEYNGPFHQVSLVDGPRDDVSDYVKYEYFPETAAGGSKGRLRNVIDANGELLRSNITYTASGNVASEYRPNGLYIVNTYYPGNDRLESRTEWVGGTKRTTHWTYAPAGDVASVTNGYGATDESTLTFEYDAASRLVGVADALGNKRVFVLDGAGNILEENTLDKNGQLTGLIKKTFDSYNRPDVVTNGAMVADYDYRPDGTLARITDGNGVVTSFSYDELKRLVSENRDDGGQDVSTANAQTDYEYDDNGEVIGIVDPKRSPTLSKYDDLGNLLEANSPDSGLTSYEYDTAGNQISQVNARGEHAVYMYDALNRLVSVDYSGTEYDILYTYDNCSSGYGRVCEVRRGLTVISYNYNGFGNLIGLTQEVDGASHSMSYSYDDQGRVKSITYPSGTVVTQNYDAVGNVVSLSMSKDGNNHPLVTGAIFAPFGNVTSYSYGNGDIRSIVYDLAGRIEAVNDPVFNKSYSYDGVGNILSSISVSDAEQFGYDRLNRIVNADGQYGNLTYEYDRNGNRLILGENGSQTSYGYEQIGNRFVSIGGLFINHDASGNVSAENGLTMRYSPDNRLVGIDGLAEYAYNGIGQRVYKKLLNNNQVTLLIYDREGRLLSELDGNGSILREHIYFGNVPVVVVKYNQGASTASYVHTDHLGTPRAITDVNNVTVWRWDSDPFGTTAANEDPDGDGTTLTYNLRFPGQYFDSETGLNYNLNRTYDPSTGRYIESDPIGLDGGLNTYLYAEANPLRYTDPLGLNPAAGCIAGSWAGPAGCGVGTAIGGGIALWMIMSTPGDTPQEQCKDKECPPCNPPVGTIGYRVDQVPPSKPHHPLPGTHVHLYKMNQNPNNCQCFWQPVGVTEPPPPPGAVPM